MITIKDGDLFSAPNGIICHQVNCMGIMGSGVAKIFKKKFPIAYAHYLDKCYKAKRQSELLGECSFQVEDSGYSCCMFAQIDYGHARKYTDYEAFRLCCKNVTWWVDYWKVAEKNTYPINMPYKIGCGLGGGDWGIVYKILEEEFKDYNLILWKL